MTLAIIDWTVGEALAFAFSLMVGGSVCISVGAFIDDRIEDWYRNRRNKNDT